MSGRDARTDARRRLRPLLVLVAVLFGGWTLWATAILPRLQVLDGWQHELRATGVRILLWVLPSAVYLRHQHGERVLAPLHLRLPKTPSAWVASFGLVGAALLAVSIDVARKLDLSVFAVWGRVWLEFEPSFPTAPLFEELIFRGVVLSELVRLLGPSTPESSGPTSARLHFWLANLLASMVFTGLHWPWWIYGEGGSGQFWMKTAGVFLLSIVLGIVFVRGRSLWPCVLLHWLNNELTRLSG